MVCICFKVYTCTKWQAVVKYIVHKWYAVVVKYILHKMVFNCCKVFLCKKWCAVVVKYIREQNGVQL